MSKNIEIFKKYNIKITEKQENLFDVYFKNLIETNKKFNLTAITDEKEVYEKHFLDSVLPVINIPKNAKLIDVGSGAGFPAIPLKIVRPDIEVFMIDSLNKRVSFLNDMILKLNLEKCAAIHSRAEDFVKNYREKFDIAVARAVAQLNTLVEYLLPLIKIGGQAIIYKSSKLDEELKIAEKAINILGGKVEKVENYTIVSDENIERKILYIKKVSSTPTKYPRSQNLPRSKPIV